MKTSRARQRFAELQRRTNESRALFENQNPATVKEEPRNRRERRLAERADRLGKAVLGPLGRGG